MSAFFWVEDFDGASDDAFVTTIRNVFGSYFGNLNQSWDSVEDIREYLKEFNIYLESSLVDAVDFISDQKNLESIDYVILDIDLRISSDPEDENGHSGLEKIIAWHTSSVEDERRRALKEIAGYHLWTLLVIDHGFPRDRIQFCSQHGKYQKSIQESFKPARIDPPDVFLKNDDRMREWIKKQANDPYTSLRRGVIDSCALLLKRLESEQGDAPEMIRLSRFPGSSTEDFKRDQAVDMLNMLPLYLPRDVSPESMPEVLRAFVRAFTMNWDRFSAHPEQIIKYEGRTGISYDKAIDKVFQNGATALKFLRNNMAHASDELVDINPAQTAVFFVLNMYVVFSLDADMDAMERALLSKHAFSQIIENPNSLQYRLNEWKKELERRMNYANLPLLPENKRKYPDGLLRVLQEKGKVNDSKDILLLLWWQLIFYPLRREHSSTENDKNLHFSEKFKEISKSSHPVHRVAMACLGELL